MGIYNYRTTLTEGARDKALEMFMPYLQKRGISLSISQLKQILLNKFVTEAGMHNLSLNSNFYLLGVARYYFEGSLTSNKQINILYPRVRDRFIPEVCQRLDALVEILRNAYVDSVGTKWEQPEDFGNLTLAKLLRKYNSKINKALGIGVPEEKPVETPKASDDYTAGKRYTYEILYSYEDAKKYNKPTEPGAWCITYGKQHYDSYIKKLKIHYVVFAQRGYEQIPRKVGKGFTKRKPHDEYGNSLICVLQSNTSPEPKYITSRWNHGSYDGTQGTEADHAYTKEEFLRVIGCDESVLQRAFEQWKINAGSEENKAKDRAAMRADRLNALRKLKYAQMMINGGADPFKIDYLDIRAIFGERDTSSKGMYFVKVQVNDTESFVTVMDRKVMHFDKYIAKTETRYGLWNFVGNKSDKFVVFKFEHPNDTFMIYDRIRHRFLEIGGVYKFRHGTGQLLGGYNSEGRWAILGVTGNQLALLDIETLKTFKARNGSPWFESITTKEERYDTNRGYNREVSFPYQFQRTLIHLVYDSSSGEDYWFNTGNGALFDVFAGMPDDMRPVRYMPESRLPSNDYMAYTNKSLEKTFSHHYGRCDGIVYMFKNIYTGEIFSIDGTDRFYDFEYCEGVIGWIPENEEYARYYDAKTHKILELEGKPVTTRYGVALEKDSSMGGFVEISLSKWYKIEDGKYAGNVTTGNFHTKVLFYNPFNGEFYHDDKSGYVFSVWGGGYVVTPGAVCGRASKDELIKSGILYRIPDARKVTLQQTKMEGKSIIGRIIREEIGRLFIKEQYTDAVDFFNKINKSMGSMRSWAETDADNGIDPEEGRMQRLKATTNAQKAGYSKTGEFKLHTYDDWNRNYRPQGISWREYSNMKL